MSRAHNAKKKQICQSKDLPFRRGGLEAFVLFFFFFYPVPLLRTDARRQHDEELGAAN